MTRMLPPISFTTFLSFISFKITITNAVNGLAGEIEKNVLKSVNPPRKENSSPSSA